MSPCFRRKEKELQMNRRSSAMVGAVNLSVAALLTSAAAFRAVAGPPDKPSQGDPQAELRSCLAAGERRRTQVVEPAIARAMQSLNYPRQQINAVLANGSGQGADRIDP